MWISKKRWHEVQNKIATLEKEQLKIHECVQNTINSNGELIEIVKTLRKELKLINTNCAE